LTNQSLTAIEPVLAIQGLLRLHGRFKLKVMENGGEVLVQVVEVEAGREIGRRAEVIERLQDRVEDVRGAIVSAFETVSVGLADLDAPGGWEIGELSASFGITLTAEAGVVVSKASLGSTFDVTITFRRTEP